MITVQTTDKSYEVDFSLLKEKSELVKDLMSKQESIILPYESKVLDCLLRCLKSRAIYGVDIIKGVSTDDRFLFDLDVEMQISICSLANFLMMKDNDHFIFLMRDLREKYEKEEVSIQQLALLDKDLLYQFCELLYYKKVRDLLSQLDKSLLEEFRELWDKKYALENMKDLTPNRFFDCENYGHILFKLKRLNPSVFELFKEKKSDLSDWDECELLADFFTTEAYRLIFKRKKFKYINEILEDKWLRELYLTGDDCPAKSVKAVLINLLSNAKDKDVVDYLISEMHKRDMSDLIRKALKLCWSMTDKFNFFESLDSE